MKTLHLLVGPVGAGKTTFGRRRALESGGLFVDVDTWMVRLFGDDARPSENVIAWYLERRERCRALAWDVTEAALEAGIDVWLEAGLVTRAEREAAYARAADIGVRLVVHHLDVPRDVRRQRVLSRNEAAAPHTQIVPLPFFERASDAWEPVSEEERARVEMVDA